MVTTLVMLATLALIAASFCAIVVEAASIFSIVALIRVSPVCPWPADSAASCDSRATSAIVLTSICAVAEICLAEAPTSLVEATCSLSVASSSFEDAARSVDDDVTWMPDSWTRRTSPTSFSIRPFTSCAINPTSSRLTGRRRVRSPPPAASSCS